MKAPRSTSNRSRDVSLNNEALLQQEVDQFNLQHHAEAKKFQQLREQEEVKVRKHEANCRAMQTPTTLWLNECL
jgi:hypothetical protein